jgi:hypothetical protein
MRDRAGSAARAGSGAAVSDGDDDEGDGGGDDEEGEGVAVGFEPAEHAPKAKTTATRTTRRIRAR